MIFKKHLRTAAKTLLGTALLAGVIGTEALAVDSMADCRPGGPMEPLLAPAAVVSKDVAGICLLCGVDNAGNVIDRTRSTFATLRTTVGVASAVSLGVTDTTTRYVAGPLQPKRVGFVVRNPDSLLTADLLRGVTVTTSLNGVDRQTFAASGLLKLDLLGLLNSKELALVGGVATADFDAVRISYGSVVRALNNLKVYGVCVQN